jgi:hypothetical protein
MKTDHRFVVGSAFGVLAALALGCGASPAIAAQLLYNASATGASQRRGVDFYPAGLLSSEAMTDAMAHAKSSSSPIELLVELDGYYRTIKIDYHGGEHYRVLERDPSKPDLLAAILAPKTAR